MVGRLTPALRRARTRPAESRWIEDLEHYLQHLPRPADADPGTHLHTAGSRRPLVYADYNLERVELAAPRHIPQVEHACGVLLDLGRVRRSLEVARTATEGGGLVYPRSKPHCDGLEYRTADCWSSIPGTWSVEIRTSPGYWEGVTIQRPGGSESPGDGP